MVLVDKGSGLTDYRLAKYCLNCGQYNMYCRNSCVWCGCLFGGCLK